MRIAIVGGGPSALFIYKCLIESSKKDLLVDIFEKKDTLGAGMPYSFAGSNDEHITNVSDNEIPQIVTSIAEWSKTAPIDLLNRFYIDPEHFNEYKVLPRLFFGVYLSGQFDLLLKKGQKAGIPTKIHFSTSVEDITDGPHKKEVWIHTANEILKFDRVIIATGHCWPLKNEGKTPGYYDSPYPPSKLKLQLNHSVALRGSSLTAIDALRTLARHNGTFTEEKDGKLSFHRSDDSPNFKVVMHSREGLLPALRFHLADSHLSKKSLLTDEQIATYVAVNNGFLSLDFIFEKDFKETFRDKDPTFYERIKDMDLEKFVSCMMELRERLDPFILFESEYVEAEQSIKRRESVYWKEMLAILSFAMNYPAKHMSAEDMLRLQKVLMPLISIVIAFVPQSSGKELMAMHEAGVLDIIPVGADSHIEAESRGGITYHYIDSEGKAKAIYYKTYVDCIGQPHLSYENFPFKSLVENKTISPATLRFKIADEGKAAIEKGNKEVYKVGEEYFLKVPGITINDDFQLVDNYGAYNDRIYMMAVPYIKGYNPDYSGLDFCEAASARIVKSIFKE